MAALVPLAAVAGCDAVRGGSGDRGDGRASPSASPGGDESGNGRAVSPLANPDGTKPGIAPLTSDADLAKARTLIDGLPTRSAANGTGGADGIGSPGGPGYERDAFGYAWKDTVDGIPLARNGCDTRNDLLRRDGENVRFRAGSDCVVASLTLHDPYTGKDIDWRKEKATEVQIDHVVPLSYGWRMGASRWPDAKREQLANDPLNLLPSDGPANNAKSDAGPADWLPPHEPLRCSYAVRFAQVAAKYDLPVTPTDKRTMQTQCTA